MFAEPVFTDSGNVDCGACVAPISPERGPQRTSGFGIIPSRRCSAGALSEAEGTTIILEKLTSPNLESYLVGDAVLGLPQERKARQSLGKLAEIVEWRFRVQRSPYKHKKCTLWESLGGLPRTSRDAKSLALAALYGVS